MRVHISLPDFTEQERDVLEAFARPGVTQFAQGPEVAAFEREFASFVNHREGIAVNSGSSANLLLFDALLQLGYLRPGDEVIVPAVTFATVVAPLYQLGLAPVYVDIQADSFNLDPARVEDALRERTRALFVVHTLGRPAPMDDLSALARRHSLLLLEDCCEAHGATVRGQPVGSFSLACTFSFFVAHNMTTGEGGMVLTSDGTLARTLRSLREFGRSFGDRWTYEDDHFAGYDRRYVFERVGYNLRMMDLQAAIGRVQLRRLPEMNRRRCEIATAYGQAFFESPEIVPGHVYYGYGLLHRARDAIVRALDTRGIETRPIFGGTLHLQPGYRGLRHRAMPTAVAERVQREGFFIPCHSAMTDEQVAYTTTEVKRLLTA
jgi:CDP-6-deoxy-D-xylo-4-hexulose-3-dehydrase